eukprot:CAMPEP_0174250448 /NCGR_PEP_ID=MMETSP0439-20130205/612_1 /TAXON_ID=0 /ORGANISM="Stereomyxa ramosa, Strain Chinc5" /LENGTH=202 /DNA_ID=CAMNT_0015330521 /DNA_START=202 /DNA_END=810 /DNA_ORIENTATION=-
MKQRAAIRTTSVTIEREPGVCWTYGDFDDTYPMPLNGLVSQQEFDDLIYGCNQIYSGQRTCQWIYIICLLCFIAVYGGALGIGIWILLDYFVFYAYIAFICIWTVVYAVVVIGMAYGVRMYNRKLFQKTKKFLAGENRNFAARGVQFVVKENLVYGWYRRSAFRRVWLEVYFGEPQQQASTQNAEYVYNPPALSTEPLITKY